MQCPGQDGFGMAEHPEALLIDGPFTESRNQLVYLAYEFLIIPVYVLHTHCDVNPRVGIAAQVAGSRGKSLSPRKEPKTLRIKTYSSLTFGIV